jgi:hypothetical protein
MTAHARATDQNAIVMEFALPHLVIGAWEALVRRDHGTLGRVSFSLEPNRFNAPKHRC